MKKFVGFFAGIIILFLLCSGIFSDIIKFFTWLFTFQYITPETSIVGSVVVKVLTFAVSYTLVGLIFSSFKWFNSKAMAFVYFIISTLLGFLFAYIVMIIEKHLLAIGITLGLIFMVSIVVLIFFHIKGKKNNIKNKE